ncbi:MAG TPA: MFS transporter [Burkholderiales bacterium]|nr:MFS transporter [Burkholderiales bacterium]
MAKPFYGWRIVAAGGALQFLQSMLLNQAFGAYVAALVEQKGWSRTSLSGAAALKSTETAILGPVLGWLVDKFGSKGIIRIGIVLFGIGFMLLSQTDTLIAFYGAFVVLALGASMCSNFPVSVAIIQWFEKRRARALSMCQFGMALGGIFVFVVAWSIEVWGWRVTAFGSGVAIIAIGWPLASIFRTRPEDHGWHVDGLPPVPHVAGQPAPAALPAFTPREALRTGAFWLISLGHAFSLLVVSAVNVHAINHMREGLGYSIAQASIVISLVTVGQFMGVMLGWAVGDKFVKRKIAAVCMFLHAAGMLMLTYATGPIILGLSAIVHGVAWGLRGPFMQAIRADYFGRRSIGMIIGLSALITVFGQIGGPMIAGGLADLTGDYRVGFTLLAVLSAVGSLFFWTARRPKQVVAEP